MCAHRNAHVKKALDLYIFFLVHCENVHICYLLISEMSIQPGINYIVGGINRAPLWPLISFGTAHPHPTVMLQSGSCH